MTFRLPHAHRVSKFYEFIEHAHAGGSALRNMKTRQQNTKFFLQMNEAITNTSSAAAAEILDDTEFDVLCINLHNKQQQI